ncbi:hypothetical protein E2562_023099 [Oryza meyeriana var. granulata]|uniref:Uncharacterized protein n=1 Tax=Oryza meyeriana var. granulata TaxID=110450 RepID=A0A6G1E046_9ORYZ|nr:hypothetical protein E2562_023099 [Oryza meyeriana var. granulata]
MEETNGLKVKDFLSVSDFQRKDLHKTTLRTSDPGLILGPSPSNAAARRFALSSLTALSSMQFHPILPLV